MTTEPPSQDKIPNDEKPKDNEEWKRTLELFKIEYEQAAQRYENIYKAIWQIFQYMAFLSAGIITFASKGDIFPLKVIILIALIPLIFWFLAIYIPMDSYGKNTREHLKHMEHKLNNFTKKYWSIEHYTNFYTTKPIWQVNQAIQFLGTILCILWIVVLIIFILEKIT